MYLNHPTTGFSEFSREVVMARIRSAAQIANRTRQPGDPMDIAISPFIATFPRVPTWNRARIEELRREERIRPWTCNGALLLDEMELSDRLVRAIDKAVVAYANGFAPNVSGKLSV